MDTYDARDDRTLDDAEQDDLDAATPDNHKMLDADEIYWIFRADPNPQ